MGRPAESTSAFGALSSLLLNVTCGLMLLDSCGSLEARMAEKVLIKPDAAANDDPLVTPERTARVAAYIDDPCDEGGFDAFCRDRHGKLDCMHTKFCHAKHEPSTELVCLSIAATSAAETAQRR